jgi:hypothetical protein
MHSIPPFVAEGGGAFLCLGREMLPCIAKAAEMQ